MIDIVLRDDDCLAQGICEWLDDHASELTDKNEKHNLKTGDRIEFLNGYNIPMRATIAAFCKESGKAYLYWDCYWYPIDLGRRLIKKY